MIGRSPLLLAAAAAMLAMPATGQAARFTDPVFADTISHRDIRYGQAISARTGQPEDLTLDLHEPAGDMAAARPLIVYAHGGGFARGDKADPWALAPDGADLRPAFVARGFVVAQINYRLRDAPPGRPVASDQVRAAALDGQHDLQAAVRWARQHAAEYRIDPDAIIAAGVSAGANIALNAAYRSDDPGDSGNPGPSSRVAATVALAGFTFENESIGPGDPPVQIIYADDDPFVSVASLAPVTCRQALSAASPCFTEREPTGGHIPSAGWAGRESDVVTTISDFLVRCVALGDEPVADVDADAIPDRCDPDRVAPTIRRAAPARLAGRTVRTGLDVTCSADGPACTVTVAAGAIARRTTSVEAGETARIALPIPARRMGRLPARVRVTVTAQTGRGAVVRRTFVIDRRRQ